MRRFLLLAILCPILAPLLAWAEEDPAGSAYLRTLTPQPPPFGRLLQDTFPYDGVRIQRWRRDDTPADWLMVWIDLRTPKLGYHLSPVYHSTDPAAPYPQSAKAHTTLDFLRNSSEPRVDLAINTVAYLPFPATNGMEVFLCDPVWQGEDNQRNPAPGKLMLGLFPGRARIDEVEALRQAKPDLAFASFLWDKSLLLRQGKITRKNGDAHARTAAGVTLDGRVLILLVADGYNPGVSEGFTPGESALLMEAAGARDAIMLDGGGSSTLVGRDPDGNPVVVNRPAGLQRRPGTLRYVAVNLGFIGLRPGDDPLPALADWEAPLHLSVWEEIALQFRVQPVRTCATATALGVGMLLVIRWIRRRFRTRNTSTG